MVRGRPTIVATSALVAILALIYVRAGLYHLNPTLAVLGFRLYEVTCQRRRHDAPDQEQAHRPARAGGVSLPW